MNRTPIIEDHDYIVDLAIGNCCYRYHFDSKSDAAIFYMSMSDHGLDVKFYEGTISLKASYDE